MFPLILERRDGRGEREKHPTVASLMHPVHQESNPKHLSAQDDAPTPHGPGPRCAVSPKHLWGAVEHSDLSEGNHFLVRHNENR